MPGDRDELEKRLGPLSTDDLVSILRNHDEEEWQPEVFDIVAVILAARGLQPAEIVAMGPDNGERVESAPTITVATFFSPAEAHTSRMALEEAGIAAWVADESLGTMYGVGVGSRLQVRATDEAAAREVLASAPARADALPDDLTDPSCPACGSRSVVPEAWVVEGETETPRWRSARRKWYYVCSDCDEAWPMDAAQQ